MWYSADAGQNRILICFCGILYSLSQIYDIILSDSKADTKFEEAFYAS